MSPITNKSCSMLKMFKYLVKFFTFRPEPENSIKLAPQQILYTVENEIK